MESYLTEPGLWIIPSLIILIWLIEKNAQKLDNLVFEETHHRINYYSPKNFTLKKSFLLPAQKQFKGTLEYIFFNKKTYSGEMAGSYTVVFKKTIHYADSELKKIIFTETSESECIKMVFPNTMRGSLLWLGIYLHELRHSIQENFLGLCGKLFIDHPSQIYKKILPLPLILVIGLPVLKNVFPFVEYLASYKILEIYIKCTLIVGVYLRVIRLIKEFDASWYSYFIINKVDISKKEIIKVRKHLFYAFLSYVYPFLGFILFVLYFFYYT